MSRGPFPAPATLAARELGCACKYALADGRYVLMLNGCQVHGYRTSPPSDNGECRHVQPHRFAEALP